MSSQVVVIHGVDNVDVVREACRKLGQAGVTSWSPYLDLGWSRDPHADTRDAIDMSQGLILIVGQDGEVSDDARQILAFAQKGNKSCYLGAKNGIPPGDLENTLWDDICDFEAGQFGSLARSSPSAPPKAAASMPSYTAPPATAVAAYPRATFKLKGDLSQFESLRGVSGWAIGFIGLAMLTFLIATLGHFQATSTVFDTANPSHDELVRFSHQLMGATLWKLGGFFMIAISLVPFLMWLHQAVKNLEALGIKAFNFTNNFAVIGFLVPFLNLFMPVLVLTTLARASMPWNQPSEPESWQENKTPNFVSLWIVAWYCALFFFSGLIRALGFEAVNPIHKAMYVSFLETISGVILLIAGTCLCLTVAKVTQWQQEHFDGLSVVKSRFNSPQASVVSQPGWA